MFFHINWNPVFFLVLLVILEPKCHLVFVSNKQHVHVLSRKYTNSLSHINKSSTQTFIFSLHPNRRCTVQIERVWTCFKYFQLNFRSWNFHQSTLVVIYILDRLLSFLFYFLSSRLRTFLEMKIRMHINRMYNIMSKLVDQLPETIKMSALISNQYLKLNRLRRYFFFDF
jgi:hypothetical protein